MSSKKEELDDFFTLWVGFTSANCTLLCGRGPRSSLRVLRHGLEVSEMAVFELPGNPNNMVKVNADDDYDTYIIVSFINATLVLSIGEMVEEITDSGHGVDGWWCPSSNLARRFSSHSIRSTCQVSGAARNVVKLSSAAVIDNKWSLPWLVAKSSTLKWTQQAN